LARIYSFDESESKHVVLYLHEPNNEPSLAFRSLSSEPILEDDFVFMASPGVFKDINLDGSLPNVWVVAKSTNPQVEELQLTSMKGLALNPKYEDSLEKLINLDPKLAERRDTRFRNQLDKIIGN
jgi:hypothetical protein